MPYIGKQLKELRMEKSLTQKELAQALGLSKSAIVQYEHNKREPNLDSLLKIEKYFNVSTQYLTGKSQFRKVSEDIFYNDNIQNSDLFYNENEHIQRKVIHLVNEFNYLIENILTTASPLNKDLILKELYFAMCKIHSFTLGSLKQYPKMYKGEQLDRLELYKIQEAYFQSEITEVELSFKKLFDINFDDLYTKYCDLFFQYAGNEEFIQMIQDTESEISQQKLNNSSE